MTDTNTNLDDLLAQLKETQRKASLFYRVAIRAQKRGVEWERQSRGLIRLIQKARQENLKP